jgi:hypothetical protein
MASRKRPAISKNSPERPSMLLRNMLRTERRAQARSADEVAAADELDLQLSIAEGRTAKVIGWLTPDEQEAFARHAREAGYRSVSDCLRALVLITTSGGVEQVLNVERSRLKTLTRNWDVAEGVATAQR